MLEYFFINFNVIIDDDKNEEKVEEMSAHKEDRLLGNENKDSQNPRGSLVMNIERLKQLQKENAKRLHTEIDAQLSMEANEIMQSVDEEMTDVIDPANIANDNHSNELSTDVVCENIEDKKDIVCENVTEREDIGISERTVDGKLGEVVENVMFSAVQEEVSTEEITSELCVQDEEVVTQDSYQECVEDDDVDDCDSDADSEVQRFVIEEANEDDLDPEEDDLEQEDSEMEPEDDVDQEDSECDDDLSSESSCVEIISSDDDDAGAGGALEPGEMIPHMEQKLDDGRWTLECMYIVEWRTFLMPICMSMLSKVKLYLFIY